MPAGRLVKVYVGPATLTGRVTAPPSKSYTHRAYALALLTDGESFVEDPLNSGDTRMTLNACRMFGAEIREGEGGVSITGGSLRLPENVVDAGNSGTTLRIFTAVSSLPPPGYVVLTGDESLRRRPMQPLLDALRSLGVDCWSTRGNGCAPIIVRSGGLKGGETVIRGDVSSQFISAILIASVRAEDETMVRVDGRPVSRKYVDATIEVMRRYGYRVEREGYSYFAVEPRQVGRPVRFRVPGDFSSASFILAGACITGGRVQVENLDTELPQADSAILDILRDFGCSVHVRGSSVMVECAAVSTGDREYDLTDSPDLLPVVAVLASRSRGETVIRGVKHARYKESDRITMTAMELGKLGVQVEVFEDGMRVKGRGDLEGGVVLDSHRDHRLFMAFTVLAASTRRGCVVDGLEWAEISYPSFRKDMETLGLRLIEL